MKFSITDNRILDPGCLNSFKGKPTHTRLVEELNLSNEEQEAKFGAKNKWEESCIDSVTLEVMNQPVRINGVPHDLNSLITQPETNGLREDPLKRRKFKLTDIQPALDLNNRIQYTIEMIKAEKTKVTEPAEVVASLSPKHKK